MRIAGSTVTQKMLRACPRCWGEGGDRLDGQAEVTKWLVVQTSQLK